MCSGTLPSRRPEHRTNAAIRTRRTTTNVHWKPAAKNYLHDAGAPLPHLLATCLTHSLNIFFSCTGLFSVGPVTGTHGWRPKKRWEREGFKRLGRGLAVRANRYATTLAAPPSLHSPATPPTTLNLIFLGALASAPRREEARGILSSLSVLRRSVRKGGLRRRDCAGRAPGGPASPSRAAARRRLTTRGPCLLEKLRRPAGRPVSYDGHAIPPRK